MIVQFKPSALGQTRWYEYLVRFVLGGAMTVVAGLIAARFGPVIGGLFLAFPAIFPASATANQTMRAAIVAVHDGSKNFLSNKHTVQL